jgi:carbohydrate diacid regulator
MLNLAMSFRLDPRLAQEIVSRTMQIISCNVNVMDLNAKIIASGDVTRRGELHEGALLALSHGRTVEIDEATSRALEGVRPGINLPLRAEGEVVGVIGLTGPPAEVRQHGELVRMTAEMMLEQARLLQLLARESRLCEELVLTLIRSEQVSPTLSDWAQRLGVNLNQPRVALVIEVDSGRLEADEALAELRHLQTLLAVPEAENLIAMVSLTELAILKPALDAQGRWNPEEQRSRVEKLLAFLRQRSRLELRIALGNYFTGAGSIARSYNTARTTLQIGKRRNTAQYAFFYQDLTLAVLLENLSDSWQANELIRPLARLKARDGNGQLQHTLATWFAHQVHSAETAEALNIHRNTLDYRLNRISEFTRLDLNRLESRLLLYIALQLDESSDHERVGEFDLSSSVY